MKILVTGSSGTIGTRLVEKLLERGHQVIGIDKRPNKWNPKINKITIQGDLCDKRTIDKTPKDFDMVVHLAANARVYNLVRNPSLAEENILISFNILEYCRKNSVKQLIFSSSREVYGDSDKLKHSEGDLEIKNCESPYTASKIFGEAIVYAYHKCYGIDFINIRLSNVYGMYDDSDRVIPTFIKLILENKKLVVYGKRKKLDFIHIDDAVFGITRSIENFEEHKNDVFNISSGEGTGILELSKLIRELMRSSVDILTEENRTGEVSNFIADVSKARRELGFEAKTGIREGIKKTIEWYMENKDLVWWNLKQNVETTYSGPRK